MLSDEQFDSALLAVANFVDLKSPHTLGHSNAVSELCGAAGEALGLPPSDVRTLRRAGLVQGFGRLGVSNAIWDKPGPLGAGERERVRMHPYFTERMLHAYQAMRDRVLIARLGRLTRRRRLCAPRFALGVWTVTRWKRSSVQPVTVRGDGGRGRPGSRPVRSTPKTAGNHIEHVYGKIDATNRATASLFAVQHGLLPEEVVTGAARRKSAEKEHR